MVLATAIGAHSEDRVALQLRLEPMACVEADAQVLGKLRVHVLRAAAFAADQMSVVPSRGSLIERGPIADLMLRHQIELLQQVERAVDGRLIDFQVGTTLCNGLQDVLGADVTWATENHFADLPALLGEVHAAHPQRLANPDSLGLR